MAVASGYAISTLRSVKKAAGFSAMLVLLIASLFSGCASQNEQGVVTESSEERTTAAEAHFARPTFNPSGEGGVSASHF
jgi:hypothetical protein